MRVSYADCGTRAPLPVRITAGLMALTASYRCTAGTSRLPTRVV